MAVDDDVLGSDETHESSASLYTVEDCFELLRDNRGMLLLMILLLLLLLLILLLHCFELLRDNRGMLLLMILLHRSHSSLALTLGINFLRHCMRHRT